MNYEICSFKYQHSCPKPLEDKHCGITSDPKSRLFTEHNVSEKNALWICRQASSAQIAREIEDYFINDCGTDGGPGGGDENSRYVYTY